MKTSKLMASPFGTFIKVFLSTVLTMWIAMDDLFAMDIHTLKALATAGIVSGMPVILNALNPKYKNYGIGSSQHDNESA